MQAIRTKYLAPTDHRGARIKAKCRAGSVTVSWDHSYNSPTNHERACLALRTKLGWLSGTWVYGVLDCQSYVHVYVPEGR